MSNGIVHRVTESLKQIVRSKEDRRWHQMLDQQAALVGQTKNGVIILGDISGFSRLIAQADLEHAQMIMLHLFGQLYQATQANFLVNEIEGDAIFAFAVAPNEPSKLIEQTFEQLKAYGHAFYHAREDLAGANQGSEVCSCRACTNVGNLSMKFIVHYGPMTFYRVGPFVNLLGGSVIVAHRLLKNMVPSHSYILLTEEALKLAPQAMREQFVPLSERIEHFGEVPVGYRVFDWEREDKKHHPPTYSFASPPPQR